MKHFFSLHLTLVKKYRFFLLIIFGTTFGIALATFTLLSFSKKENFSNLITGELKIEAILAPQRTPNSLITIEGNGFSEPLCEKPPHLYPGKVIFSDSTLDGVGDEEALIANWTEKAISVFVPLAAKSGKVYVVLEKEKERKVSNGFNFEVSKPNPQIKEISETSGTPDSRISIKGDGFGNRSSGNHSFINPVPDSNPGKVIFGKKEAKIVSWNKTEVAVSVPNEVGKKEVYLTLFFAGGEIASNKLEFAISEPQPKITTINPESSYSTEKVTISGQGFGETDSSLENLPGKVIFGGIEGVVSGWSDKEIVVYVPSKAQPGEAKVLIKRPWSGGANESNSLAFTIKEPNLFVESYPKTDLYPSGVFTIFGSGFGNQVTSGAGVFYPGKVLFNVENPAKPLLSGITALPVLNNWEDGRVKVYLPERAKSGKVVILRNNGSNFVNSEPLEVEINKPEPKIEKITPEKVFPGSFITIAGKGFGNQVGNNFQGISYSGKIFVGKTQAIPIEGNWRDDFLRVYIPANATSQKLFITRNFWGGSVSSNEVDFAIKEPKPEIRNLSLSGDKKKVLEITGEDFGFSLPNNSLYPGRVVFSDGTDEALGKKKISANIVSWDNKKIVAAVPKEVISEKVYLLLDYGAETITTKGFKLPAETVLSAVDKICPGY